jgi:hypothetical protein
MDAPDEALAAIAEIPGNAANLDRLRRQLGTGVGLVPFVGAGLSIPLGFPGWPEFLTAQARLGGIAATVQHRIQQGEYEEAAGDLLEALGHRAFYDAIEDTFGPSRLAGKTIGGAVAMLPELVRGPVVTTNFDRVLETVFDKAQRPLEVVWGARVDVTTQSLHEDRRFLLKMHGDAAVRTDRVLTRSEYEEHYGSADAAKIDWSRKLPRTLRLILTSRPLLFVGCSLNRDRILGLLLNIAAENPDIGHYAIVEAPHAGKIFHERAKYLSDHGIRPIWYPHARHDAIGPLLAHLASQPGSRPTLAPSLPRTEARAPVRPLRKREPLVEDNRPQEVARLASFFNDPALSVFWLHGLGGIGKSTLARSALQPLLGTRPVAWIACEGVDADQVLARLQDELKLTLKPRREADPLEERIVAVLGSIAQPSILVLDGFEVLLDSNDEYRSRAIGVLMETLAGVEHQLKVVVTTRRLPRSVVEGSAGIATLALRGLPLEKARELFRTRARVDADRVEAITGTESFQKLRGHPKWIELLASALGSLPVQEVTKGLLAATDIGEFVLSQVLAQLSETEHNVVRAAAVFRGPFSFEALTAVHGTLDPGRTIVLVVRGLVRRDVLESLPAADADYYLHPLIREALPPNPQQEAAAHAAAAAWFLRAGIQPEILTTWDDGLYHLRRAAEAGDGVYVQNYQEFVEANRPALSYAGWGRRLLEELNALIEFSTGDWERFQLRTLKAIELFTLDKNEAATVLKELTDELSGVKSGTPEDDDRGASGLLASLKVRLAETLAKRGDIEEAQRLADEAEALSGSDEDPVTKYLLSNLRFQIARKGHKDSELSRLAAEVMHWAEVRCEAGRSPGNLDGLAEAHFNAGIASLKEKDLKGYIQHMTQQLRLKLEIGKLSGVAAGLKNCGFVLALIDPSGAAMLLASEQIELEMGVRDTESAEDNEGLVDKLLANPEKVMAGHELLDRISPKLAPYYERGIERRLGSVAKSGSV